MAFVRLNNMPAPASTRVCDIPSMTGGINLHDSPTQLRDDQSPGMCNLYRKDGLLCSRPAQAAFGVLPGASDGDCAAEPRLYQGHYIFHRGDRLWAVSEDLQQVRVLESAGLPEVYGTFVRHNGLLYYKTKGIYLVINEDLQVRSVEPFAPTLLINADPDAVGAGDLYQPLNRLSPTFYVTYSPAENETRDFHAPFYDCRIEQVEVMESDGTWSAVEFAAANNSAAHIRLARITKEEQVEAGQNNVRIRFSRAGFDDYEKGYAQLMSCRLAAVYGGGEGLCMVFGGCEAQPNGYFWSANTDVAMDPGYFPHEHYNLAGDFGDPITAFGQQQNMLVIFQQNRIGAARFGTAEIDGRTFITMDYATISPRIGCDVPGSVQLIDNNLVFANRARGIFLLLDTSAAGENMLVHISDNIERSDDRGSLLADLRTEDGAAVSIDDGQRYWLLLGEHAWLWDYRLGGAVGSPRSLSWFYWNGICPPACTFGDRGMVGRDGVLRRFDDGGSELFESILTLPVRHFGTYAQRKDIGKIVFSLDGSAEGAVGVEYLFDGGQRQDPAPLVCKGEGDEAFSEVFVRKPRCLDVQHFFCRLRTMGRMAFRSAQIFYVLRGEER